MSKESGLDERGFEAAADERLRGLARALDEVDGIEVDLQMGVLTIEFSDGAKYIVNSHRAARQIWMAAERSAWHFDPVDGGSTWVSPKSGEELTGALEAVLGRKLGRAVKLGA